MTAPKTLLATLFALSTVVVGAIAWSQHLEIRRLETDRAARALERSELETKLAEARHTTSTAFNAPLDQSLPLAAETAVANVPAEDDPGDRGPGRNNSDRRSAGLERMEELMKNPEFAAAVNAQAKSHLDRQYADLFKRLNLPPAQLEKLKNLLAEKQTARIDVLGAARAEGLDVRENRAEIAVLVREAQAELDVSIQAALGPNAFATYQAYEQSGPQRATVGALEQRLSYSTTPLTTAQSDQLLVLLSNPTNLATETQNNHRLRNAVPITDQIITQAAAMLAPVQLQALRELQATQQAGRVVGDAFRANSVPPPGGG